MSYTSILIIALALIFGVLGARIFKTVKVPHVVAFIFIGLVIGSSGLNIINHKLIQDFVPINYVALGIIGFLIGGELKKDILKRYGTKMILIMIFQGISAFLVITILVGVFTKNWALAIMLGAMASATAPAATVEVLREYKSAGLLTTFILAIVALDDGLALLLYGFASSIAKILVSNESFSLISAIKSPLYEIFGSAILGLMVAYIFKFILNFTQKYKSERDLTLSFTFGAILLVVAASLMLKLDLILAAMFFGMTFVNIAPYHSKQVFNLMKDFSPPIYILFFILVGARLKIRALTNWILIASIIYISGRTFGKIFGSYIGAAITKLPSAIRKYLGVCLLSQAGVTVGLAILTAHRFPQFGETVIGIITTTTFLFEFIGPPLVRFGIVKTGEYERNITEEDLLEMYKVKDVMDRQFVKLKTNQTLNNILQSISKVKSTHYPVLDDNEELVGSLTIFDLQPIINLQDSGNLFIAKDFTKHLKHRITPEKPLKEAFDIFHSAKIDFLPVVQQKNPKKIIGILELHSINKILAHEIGKRQKS